MQIVLTLVKAGKARSADCIFPHPFGRALLNLSNGLLDWASKTVFKGKGTVRGVLSDVFKTMKWAGSTNFAGVNSRFNGNGEMQQVKLNFSYRFGSNTVKAARQRNIGIEDENKRANSGGGTGSPMGQ
jgi:hypothetical protein